MTSTSYAPLKVVPWAVVDGQPVYTCGFEEDDLQLTPLIAGWNKVGFYVRPECTVDQVQAQVDAINWRRVKIVKDAFDFAARPDRCMVAMGSRKLVTEVRYARLMRACMAAVSDAAFDREVAAAVKFSH